MQKMRSVLLLALLVLASCAGHSDGQLATRRPGLNIAEIALANGAPATALHVAQGILANDPHNVAALVEAGRAYFALGERAKAEASFTQALAAAPDDVDAALGLGRLALGSNPAAAEAVLQRAATNHPANVAVQVDLGIANDLLGRHEVAQRAYRAALAVEPGRIAASVNLGLSLALSGSPDAALAILRPLATAPTASPRMRQNLAAALVLAGENEQAAAILTADMPQPRVLPEMAAYRLLAASP